LCLWGGGLRTRILALPWPDQLLGKRLAIKEGANELVEKREDEYNKDGDHDAQKIE
jgi:hypothetical protein